MSSTTSGTRFGHDPRTVMVRLRAALPGLRTSEQRVAEFVLAEPGEAASMTVAEVALRTNTSTTSVLRCAQRLGYERFRDLRLDLAGEVTREQLARSSPPVGSADIDAADSLADIVAKVARDETVSIADTAVTLNTEQLSRAVELVGAARRVDAFGVGASAFVCLDLHQKLSRIGRVALHWPDPHSAWTSAATLDGDCVAIGVSHSGTTTDVVDYLRIARAAGAATVGITNFPDSALASESDVVLATAARESELRSGALGSRIAQLMVVDCLFLGVATASYQRSMSALGATYDVAQRRRTAPGG